MRSGEITGVEVDAIDFVRREVDVRQQLVCVAGRAPFLGPPNTKTSARTVELPEVTAAALAWHIKHYPPIKIEIDDLTDPRYPRRRMAKLIFFGSTLNPIHRADWAHVWVPAPTLTLNTYVEEWPEPHEKPRSIVDGALARVSQMCPGKITRRRNASSVPVRQR